MAYLNIEKKEDSPEKLIAIAGKPSKNFLAAGELNLIVKKINDLNEKEFDIEIGDVTTLFENNLI